MFRLAAYCSLPKILVSVVFNDNVVFNPNNAFQRCIVRMNDNNYFGILELLLLARRCVNASSRNFHLPEKYT